MTTHTAAREAKFRQSGFVYLLVALLYESSVWVLHRGGGLPAGRGPVAVWLVAGALVAALVFWALYVKKSVAAARIVAVLGAFRLPTLIGGAFLPGNDPVLPSSFYLTALIVIVVNLWMLARAGWDL